MIIPVEGPNLVATTLVVLFRPGPGTTLVFLLEVCHRILVPDGIVRGALGPLGMVGKLVPEEIVGLYNQTLRDPNNRISYKVNMTTTCSLICTRGLCATNLDGVFSDPPLERYFLYHTPVMKLELSCHSQVYRHRPRTCRVPTALLFS